MLVVERSIFGCFELYTLPTIWHTGMKLNGHAISIVRIRKKSASLLGTLLIMVAPLNVMFATLRTSPLPLWILLFAGFVRGFGLLATRRLSPVHRHVPGMPQLMQAKLGGRGGIF